MSADANRKLVQGYFAVLNDGLVDLIDREFFTANYQLHLNSVPAADRTRALLYLRAIQAAFPGLFHAIEDIVAEGDRVVTRITLRGVHQGALGQWAPTSDQVEFTAIYIHRIVGDRIAEQWVVSDQQALIQQLKANATPGQ